MNALSESLDDMFRNVIECSRNCIMILDLENRILFTNRAGLALFELDLGDVVGRRWPALAPHAVRDAIQHACASARSGQPVSFEAELPTSTGRAMWWDVNVAPLRERGGAICGLMAVLQDRTSAKLASQAAEARWAEAATTAAILRAGHRMAQLGAWRYDCVTRRVLFTTELGELLGGMEQSQDVAEALKIWHDEDRPAFQARLETAAARGETLTFEGRNVLPDGQVRWMWVMGEPEMANGRCVALSGASQDITEQREMIERLRASKQAAQKAADAMSGFLATMSHEIRTPLNGVLGMAQAMAMEALPAAQAERLKVIRTSGEALLALLNDLLDLSKIEAGKIELEDGLVDTRSLTDGLAAFQSLLVNKDVHFTVTVAPDAQGVWSGDPTRVRQILNNLVANAVKFTKRGAITVTLCNQNERLVMRVADTGIGIVRNKLADVFDKFVQGDASTTRRFGGSGLGLAICHELVTLMGGDIGVESVDGEGTTFSVSLPLSHIKGAEAPAPVEFAPATQVGAPTPTSGLRVLAAEDNATNQLVLKTLLMAVGIEPMVVSNGQEALNAWRAAPWDLVLMDVQMPVLDGVAAVVQMRAAERRERRARTPVIALTANAMAHQHAEYLAAGMDALVAKPIELATLLKTIDAVISAPLAPARSSAGNA